MINILYLLHRRPRYHKVIIPCLAKSNFKDFHITLSFNNLDSDQWTCNNQSELDQVVQSCQDHNLSYSIEYHSNYLDKIKSVCNKDYDISIKMDEDIFLSPKLWNYFFNNLSLLDNENNLLLTASLSTGIPTIDNFIVHNFEPDQQTEIFNEFSNTVIPSIWGADYSSIRHNNPYTTKSYYEKVARINHHYKGIHPIRCSERVITKFNSLLEKNLHKFNDDRTFFISQLNRPYICNSFFAIKTKEWKKIIYNNSLYVDAYDEVPINKYRHQTGKVLQNVENAFGIHTVYNTIAWPEEDFFNRIYPRIIEQL